MFDYTYQDWKGTVIFFKKKQFIYEVWSKFVYKYEISLNIGYSNKKI